MKKLIIRAHPRSDDWYNLAITKAIYEKCIQAGHTATIIDLYKNYQQPFLSFGKQLDIPHQKELQKIISDHDELIFIFPVRWIDCPAILKNFLDVNMSKEFGYTVNEKWKEVGLLKGKTARIVATAGWPSFFYRFIRFVSWTKGRLGYCGINHLSTNVLSYTMKTNNQRRQRFIEKVAKICSK